MMPFIQDDPDVLRWQKVIDSARTGSARHQVATAVRKGAIVKGGCEICGSTVSVHAHHDDYNKPLDIRWLCLAHHVEWHNSTNPIYLHGWVDVLTRHCASLGFAVRMSDEYPDTIYVNSGGRPRTSLDGQLLDTHITVNVTSAELVEIDAARGPMKRGAYVRAAALDKARATTPKEPRHE